MKVAIYSTNLQVIAENSKTVIAQKQGFNTI